MGKYSLNKKTGKNYCDNLWSSIIRLEFNNKCAICESLGVTESETILNAHHLISRRSFKYRWDINNGILLCPKHHEFDLHISAHTAPWGFEEWMKDYRKEQYDLWLENRKNLEYDGKNKYEEIYHELEKTYKNKTGDFFMIKRIHLYLLSKDKGQIMLAHKMNGETFEELAKKYQVSANTMKKFITMS